MWDKRLEIIEDFIQLLVNSKHSYAFIKALTLQALTKYKTMVERSDLDEENVRYMPLYRPRSFREKERKIAKYIDCVTWYKGTEFLDPYKKEWRRRIIKKNNTGGARVKDGRETDCVMFVPPSSDSMLYNQIVVSEREILRESNWKIKVVEQSGIPLAMSFVPKFKNVNGCPRGQACRLCKENDGLECSKKKCCLQGDMFTLWKS